MRSEHSAQIAFATHHLINVNFFPCIIVKRNIALSERLIYKSFMNASNSTDCIKAINKQSFWITRRVCKCDTLIKSTLEADTPLCVLYYQGIILNLISAFCQKKILFFYILYGGGSYWVENLDFYLFQGPTGPMSWKEWKLVLLRGSLQIKMNIMQFVVIL